MATSMNHTLVGVCDEEIPVSFKTTWQCNKLGGQPDWMNPSSQHPACITCGDLMYLVAQMYCPLEAASYHRIIYIFTCIRKTCVNRRESWRVFRYQIPVAKAPSIVSKEGMQEKLQEVTMVTEEWCEDADDWGSESEDEDQCEDNALSTSGQGGVNQRVSCQETGFMEQHFNPAAPDQSDDGHSSKNSVTMVTHSSEDVESAIGSISEIVTMATGVCSCKEAPVTTTENTANQGHISTEFPNEKSKSSSDTSGLPWSFRPAFVDKETHQVSDEKNCEYKEAIGAMESLSIDNKTGAPMLIITPHSPPSFTAYFVNVFEEPMPSTVDTRLSNRERELMIEYQQREGVDLLEWQEQNLQVNRVSSGDETYEKTTAKHGDEVFAAFAKRVQLCPEQCIRYSWNGNPIYQTSASEGGIIPRCVSCGGPLVFEFQLMPALINVLQDTDQSGAALDFGVVIIYTCRDSCWDDSSQPGKPLVREEYVVFQADPDSSLIAQANYIVKSQST